MKKISEIMNILKKKISEIKLSEIKLTAQQKKIAVCGVAAAVVVIAVIIGVNGKSSKKSENDAASVTENEESKILSKDGTGLQKNADEKVNTLINNYLTASKDGNVEALEKLVSNGDELTKEQVQKPYEHVEDIQNVACYTLKGPEHGADENSYIVYVYYELKFKEIETAAPGLMQLYVASASDGSYVIMLDELDDYVEKAREEALNRDDVKALIELVNKRYTDAATKDQKLKDYIEEMNKKAQEKAQQAKKPASTEAAN